jgi:hypothetical protein
VNAPVKQETGVRLSCILGPYIFNIFTDGITACISEENPHLQAVEKQIILPLLLTDNLAIGTSSVAY